MRGRQMETNEDYRRHFSRRVFQQITNTFMTVTDGGAAGNTQLLRLHPAPPVSLENDGK